MRSSEWSAQEAAFFCGRSALDGAVQAGRRNTGNDDIARRPQVEDEKRRKNWVGAHALTKTEQLHGEQSRSKSIDLALAERLQAEEALSESRDLALAERLQAEEAESESLDLALAQRLQYEDAEYESLDLAIAKRLQAEEAESVTRNRWSARQPAEQSRSESLSSALTHPLQAAVEQNGSLDVSLAQVLQAAEPTNGVPHCNALIDSDGYDAFERTIRAARDGCASLFTDQDFGDSSWRRPEELWNSGLPIRRRRADWLVVRDNPRCDDVVQGTLGSCWLVSALAALAAFRNGALVLSLFVNVADRQHDRGLHGIRLCVDGRWRLVLVDERFPTRGDGRLAYATCRRGQLFGSLIEKAYAKLCGTYDALEGGRAAEALYLLTGCACCELKTEAEPDELWATILSAHEAHHVCVASSRAQPLDGLAPNHAYAVVSVLELYDAPPPISSGQRHRLLRLADPHGSSSQYRWRGRWSEGSSDWTPETRDAARLHEGGDTRGFFVSLDDLRKGFETITVCELVGDDWCEIRTDAGQLDAVVLEPVADAQATLHFAQLPARMPFSCRASAALLLVDAETKASVASSFTTLFDNTYIRCHLSRGSRYLLIPVVARSVSAAFVVQSSKPVLVNRSSLCAQSRRHATLAYARQPAFERLEFDGAVATYIRNDGDALFFAIDNMHSYASLKVVCNLSIAKNCATSQPVPLVTILAPRHAALIVVATATDMPFAYRLERQLHLLLTRSPPRGESQSARPGFEIHQPVSFGNLWPPSPSVPPAHVFAPVVAAFQNMSFVAPTRSRPRGKVSPSSSR